MPKNKQELKNMLDEVQRSHQNLQHTQDQLIQSEKLASLGQLSAGIAHEINNPLVFIKSNLSTLEKYMERMNMFYDLLKISLASGAVPDSSSWNEIVESAKKNKLEYIFEDLDGMFTDMREGVERIKKIILDLKLFARDDNSEVLPIDINDVLESVMNIVFNEIKYKAVLKKEYGDTLPVLATTQRLGQVFINILVNAAHAIDTSGIITVRTYMQDGLVCVDIADTGRGMTPEVMKKVFDPFFTTKEAGQGTGLGLSVCYEIVKRFNGWISVRSVPGEGTVFTAVFPPVDKENE